MHWTFIFLGAGMGGVMRHSLGRGVHHFTRIDNWPIGTFVVNVIGSAVIGFLLFALAGAWPMRDEMKLAITVGVLGGFTTFSSFSRETIELFHAGRPGAAAMYIVLSNACAITSTWVGYLLAKRVLA